MAVVTFTKNTAANNDEVRYLGNGWGPTGTFQVSPPVLRGGLLQAGTKYEGVGLRFTSVTIPNGATIQNAKLTFTCDTSFVMTGADTEISAQDADNPDGFTSDTWQTLQTRWNARTTAQIDWDNISAWTAESTYDSPEIKTVIQEIVDRAGWASGNAMVLFWDDWEQQTATGSDKKRSAYPYNISNAKAVLLTVAYEPSSNAGYIWMEGDNLHGFDENGVEGVYLRKADVDNTPVDDAIDVPISSDWAYEHVAAADPHPGYVLESLFDAHTILQATSDNTPLALTVAEQRIVGRITSGNITALTGAEALTILTAQAGAAFDWNDQELDNIKTLNLSSGTELTISSGAVTATQGHHSIDTEADATTDDLDTINGLETNDLLFIYAANGARTVRIRNGEGNIFLRHQNETKSYHFSSPSGATGTFYSAGEYLWAAADANLNEGSLTVNHGTANISYAMHAGLVAAAAGATDAGTVSIVVSGTSIDDEGNRSAADSETIVADITAMSTDAYYETVKKWLGTITYTLTPAGGATTFNADFNYGLSKYEDFANQDFTINTFECVGFAGASDTSFNIRLFHHNSADWTYHATAFIPGPTAGDTSELANMNTTHSTEQNLSNTEPFAYKRTDLNTDVTGNNGEGLVLEVTTGANKAVEDMDIHIGVHTMPKYLYLAAATQHALFMKHGANWHQV